MTDTLPLDGRTGLPKDLRVFADRYPREMWEGHANFPGLTAFWLDMHGRFRAFQRELILLSRGFLDGTQDSAHYGQMTARFTGAFLDGLHGHHNIEDHHYFPRMARLDTRVARAFDLLDADHHTLGEHMYALAEATNAVLRPLEAGDDPRDPAAALLTAQEGFERFLDRHLTDEEDVVVPLILEYGADFH